MQYGGLVGLFAHPIYYFVWTILIPQPYDNLYLRLSAALLCLPVAFQQYWPTRFEAYLVACWHFCLVYSLVFVCTFLAIKNSFSTMWMMTEVMVVFSMALFIEIPLLLMTYVVTGFAAAFAAAIITSESPLLLSTTDQASLALLPVVLLCSMVFSRTMQLGRARAYIESNKTLTTLIGSIAHEMRNPLGKMKHAMENISQLLPPPGQTNANQIISANTVNDIYENIAQGLTSCSRGLQVIDITLHEVSHHEIDPDNFEYLSAATITNKAINEYGFDSPEERNKVSIHILNDFTFNVDETAYIYIIFNIIKNALYYFKEYPNARITIAVDRQKIIITDTGPGIPESVLNKLFKEFTTAGKKNGTGLGLAYCFRTMQAFHGKIHCVSAVGEYTTFTLTFPVISQDEIDAHTKDIFQLIKSFFIHKRILVVDDETIYHTSVPYLLKEFGCTIDAAENGLIAMDMLRTWSYDLVLMDLNMPGKDGYITTVEIRSGVIPHQQHIPIIAYTVEPNQMAKIKIQKVGMNGFINKHCSQLEFVKVLFNTIEELKQRDYLLRSMNHLSGKTILTTDNELFNRQYLEMCANEWGMKSLHAGSGQTALDMLKKYPDIDIVFMDMHMPVMSGVETTKRIRANPAYRHKIIIAVTADFSKHAIEEAKAAGMNDFVTKPIDKIVLMKKLIQLVIAQNRSNSLSAQAISSPASAPPLLHPPSTPQENIKIVAINPMADTSSNRFIPQLQSQMGFFQHMPLINNERLVSSKSNFNEKFQELLQRMINDLIKKDQDLQIGFDNNQDEALLDLLHSFSNVAGYIGAHALHQYIKLRLYPAVSAGRFPEEEAWVETVHALVIQSVDALSRDWLEQPENVD